MENTISNIRLNRPISSANQEQVEIVKKQTGALLDYLYMQSHEMLEKHEQDTIAMEALRCMNFAFDKYEEASMWAVKALTATLTPKETKQEDIIKE